MTDAAPGRVLQLHRDDLRSALVEGFPDAIVIGCAGRIAYLNPAAATLLGAASAAQLVDAPTPQLAVELGTQGRQEPGDHPASSPVAARWRRVDGDEVEVAVTARPCRLDGEDGVLLVARQDGRDHSRAALERSEQRFRQLFEGAPVGIFTTRSTGEVLKINPTMARILGCGSFQEVLEHYGDLSRDLYVSPQRRREFVSQLLEHGVVEDFEYQAKTADGRVIWLTMNARIAHRCADGSLIIEGFTSDVTARRELEQQLAQAQKLESVGRLAGGVAHDFNNMLSVILGRTELALAKLAPGSPLRSDLEEICTVAERSADLTRQLLAFARRQPTVPKVLDLNQAVAGLLSMLRRLIGEHVEVQWSPRFDLWPVRMDPTQVQQVLTNLCVNARDAVGGGGRITISTANVTRGADEPGGDTPSEGGEYVMLAVADDGHGMDADTLGHVFEPFFTTKATGEGTGLGLATVYGIVTQNRGLVEIDSQPGLGTTVRLLLPRHRGDPARDDDTTAERPVVGGGETVLVVEDEPAILEIVTTMLSELGYRVLSAASPAIALRLADDHRDAIQLLVTDLVMPGMSGRALADELARRGLAIRRVFMSGYPADAVAEHGELGDDVTFLPKPFTVAQLAAAVRTALTAGPGDTRPAAAGDGPAST